MGRLLGFKGMRFSPSSNISPVVGVSNPEMILSSVDLPQPEGPSSANISPDLISNETFSSAAKRPKYFDKFLMDTMGLSVISACYGNASSLLWMRNAKKVSISVNNISTVDAALISGVTEKRTIEYIFTGNVTVFGPEVKKVTIKSSNDKVNESNAPAIKPGFFHD